MIDNALPAALPCPDATSVTYHQNVRAVLTATALYDPQTRTTSATGSATQLAFHTLDGICEVLEWNNEGSAADEVACVWLSLLRWYRNTGRPWPESAPFSLPRALDEQPGMSTRSEADSAVEAGLATGEMQLLQSGPHPDQTGPGALARSAMLGLLPVADPATVAQLTAKTAALTHNDRQTLAQCVALAGLVRCCLALAGTDRPVRAAGELVRQWARQLPVTGLDGTPGVSGLVEQALAVACAVEESVAASEGNFSCSVGSADAEPEAVHLAAILVAAAHGMDAVSTAEMEDLECAPAIDLLCAQWSRELGYREGA